MAESSRAAPRGEHERETKEVEDKEAKEVESKEERPDNPVVLSWGSANLWGNATKGGFIVSGPLDYAERNFEQAEMFEAVEYFLDNARRAAHNGEPQNPDEVEADPPAAA